MIRVAAVGDLHFGTEVPAAVEALVRLARAQPPDVLIVSGDITQRARRGRDNNRFASSSSPNRSAFGSHCNRRWTARQMFTRWNRVVTTAFLEPSP